MLVDFLVWLKVMVWDFKSNYDDEVICVCLLVFLLVKCIE